MKLAAVALLLAGGLALSAGSAGARSVKVRKNARTAALSSPALDALTRRYGIAFEAVVRPFKTYRNGYNFSPRVPDPKELVRYEALLAEELAIYPPDFFRNIRLNRIVLNGENLFLYDNGTGAGVDGLAETEERTLYLDVGTKYNDGIQSRQTLHHEIFHFVDGTLHGDAMQDPDWDAFNPPGFVYHAVTDTKVDNRALGSTPGFLSLYTMTKGSEDRAETYGDMIAYPDLVAGRAETDEIVNRKAAYLRRELAEHCRLDAAFWGRIARRHLERLNTQSLAAYDKIAGDNAASLRLYMKAAVQGDADAMFMVGYSYMHGRGAPADPAEAFRWLMKSAEAGNKFGQQGVGYFYESGLGTEKNIPEAIRWYRLSAAQGFSDADAGLARVGAAAAPR